MTLNNSASMVALGNLNKNVKKVGTTLAKIASGDRIPSAKYDSAGLAMSEILREQLRSLHQDQQNVQNGSAMFKVAAGGIDDIIQNIRRLKELAINSANDSNSDIDRVTIQKEIDASLSTIEDIAVGTEYNEIKLLNGAFARNVAFNINLERTSGNTYTDAINLRPSNFVDGVFTVTEPGKVYKFDGGMDSGQYTINVTASNVKFVGGGATSPDVSIVMQNAGELWIENLSLTTHADRNLIDFQTGDNFLHFAGVNSLNKDYTGNTFSSEKAIIHTGGNLTVAGEQDSGTDGTLIITQSMQSKFIREWGAGIGSNGRNPSPRDDSQANINILSGSYEFYFYGNGSAIGTGCGSSIGDITINDGNLFLSVSDSSVAIGADGSGATAGKIVINGGDITAITRNDALDDWSGNISAYTVGIGNTPGFTTVDSVEFNGGNIYIENQARGKAVSHWRGVPESGFQSNDKIYQLGNIANGSYLGRRFGKDFIIHHGTKSNQMDLFYINSMRPKAMNLEKLDVTTRSKAETAIGKIDKALEYALDVATDVGSYMERLEHTESNLEIKAENTALSDSVLRDADMAKEMTEYTKFNVLTQSAQAGQNQSQVLSLLQ